MNEVKHKPLSYLILVGIFLISVGITIGIYVANEWFKGIDHIPLTILDTLLIVMGIGVLIMVGISELMVSLHEENMHMIRQIINEKEKK